MDDDMERPDAWLDSRLKAAARDAMAVPRRRVLLTSAVARRRDLVGWMRGNKLVVALVALNAATGAAVVALGLSLSSRGGQTSPPAASPAPTAALPGSVTGSVTLDITQRGDPTSPPAFTVAFGSVWIADVASGNVIRLDENTLHVTATIAVDTAGGASALATDGVALWATSAGRNAIVRIDPVASRVVDTIAVEASPMALAVSGSTLWVATRPALDVPGTLSEVDVTQHRVVRSFRIGTRPDQVGITPQAVWVDNAGDGTLSRVDIATGEVATTAPNAQAYDYGYVGMAVDSTGAWAVDENRAILEHVDGATLLAGRATGVGEASGTTDERASHGPLGLAVADGSAWVATPAHLVRVDLVTGVARSMDLADGRAVVAADGAIWVVAGDRTQTRIVKIEPAA